jgi:phosphoribosylformylglycinamidine synthase subunit I (EC 6.3.5.3)
LHACRSTLEDPPHPERAADPALGSTDGLKLFEGALAALSVGV